VTRRDAALAASLPDQNVGFRLTARAADRGVLSLGWPLPRGCWTDLHGPGVSAVRDAVRIPVQCELSAPAPRQRRFAQAPMRNAQLLKHFLAAKIAANRQRAVTLLYAYWKPIDVDRLLTAWEHTGAGHVAALRERYGVTVGDLER
jgi:hypothetical protein